jgi:tetratricopeptide (TPR) repeat protein
MCPPATDGEIAAVNLASTRRRFWSRFTEDPHRAGVAEAIVEQEQLAAQFLGDISAVDRLEALATQVARLDETSVRAALIQARVASITHRFADARRHLAYAELCGAQAAAIHRLLLSVDQACGVRLDAVLAARRRMAAASSRLEDLVPLGALLADLREFDEAERIYYRALRQYQDVSPFALAWVCFQVGVLWGELVPEPDLGRAAQWYRKAIEYLPRYVKARVHLAEIYSNCGRTDNAEALLVPAISSGDPEVCWRLADVMVARRRFADAEAHMQTARSGFELLIQKHLLAFADHAAEFYSRSGNDCRRALDLARVNVANRPTLRAFEQAYAIAVGTGDAVAASEIRTKATERCGTVAELRLSLLAAPGAASIEMQSGMFQRQRRIMPKDMRKDQSFAL